MPRRDALPDLSTRIAERFGPEAVDTVLKVLSGIQKPTPPLCSAAVFLARSLDELPSLVALTNTDPQTLLNAAAVKEERGGGH
jgi:hypothetical protein